VNGSFRFAGVRAPAGGASSPRASANFCCFNYFRGTPITVRAVAKRLL